MRSFSGKKVIGSVVLAAAAILVGTSVPGWAQVGASPPTEAVPKGKKDALPAVPAPGQKSQTPSPKKPQARAPGSSTPDDPAKRARLLSDLYALLATAEDQESAAKITTAIEHVWQSGAGDTVNVLLDRAVKAAAEERPDLALQLLATVTRIAPDYTEGFNRRAYVYYGLNEFKLAMGDLRRVLALDPNHYKALEGLGQILREIGQKQAALEVYRRLMAVHPHWSGGKTAFEELERTVTGQGT